MSEDKKRFSFNGGLPDIVKKISYVVSLLTMTFFFGVAYAISQVDIKSNKSVGKKNESKIELLAEKQFNSEKGIIRIEIQGKQNQIDIKKIDKRTEEIQKITSEILGILKERNR